MSKFASLIKTGEIMAKAMTIAASATHMNEGNLVLLGVGVMRLVPELHITTKHAATLVMQTAPPTPLNCIVVVSGSPSGLLSTYQLSASDDE